MRESAIAEMLGAHMASSTPSAEILRRVALGELLPDEAMALLRPSPGSDDDGETSDIDVARLLSPPTPDREQERFDALVARMDRETTKGPGELFGAWWWVTSVLAVAALLTLVFMVRQDTPPEPIAFAAGYQVRIGKVPTQIRGTRPASEGTPRLLETSTLHVELVPEEAVNEDIGVVVLASAPHQRPRPLVIEPTITNRGGIEIDAPIRELGLSVGSWELIFAVGPLQALPSPAELASASDEATGYEVITTQVEIVSGL